MNITDYKKLASKCEKHISRLAIALDGVVKAEAAGQDSYMRSSARRAQVCLSDVLDCAQACGDKELLAPLYRMGKALAELEDGQLVAEIEADLREFRAKLDSGSHSIDTSSHQLAYSGNTLD